MGNGQTTSSSANNDTGQLSAADLALLKSFDKETLTTLSQLELILDFVIDKDDVVSRTLLQREIIRNKGLRTRMVAAISKLSVSADIFRKLNEKAPLLYSFSLDNQVDREAALAVCELDFKISRWKPSLVPREVSELKFFFNYFSHLVVALSEFLDNDEDLNSYAPKSTDNINGAPSNPDKIVDNLKESGTVVLKPSASASSDESKNTDGVGKSSSLDAVLNGTKIKRVSYRPKSVVVVGSTNPVKINAVKSAFITAFPEENFEFRSMDAPSGVSAQPVGENETRLGALNRARHCAIKSMTANSGSNDKLQTQSPISFVVGIEGGVKEASYANLPSPFYGTNVSLDNSNGSTAAAEKDSKSTGSSPTIAPLEVFAIIAIYCIPKNRWSLSSTATFPLPEALGKQVRAGVELGEADDRLMLRKNSKQGDGTVGVLTRGVIDRTGYYTHAVTLALVPFTTPSSIRDN